MTNTLRSPGHVAYDTFVEEMHGKLLRSKFEDVSPTPFLKLPARVRKAWEKAASAAGPVARSVGRGEAVALRSTIVFYAEHDEPVLYDFPVPAAGVPRPVMVEGSTKAILPFGSWTQEQRAYWTFWEEGAKSRIDKLIQAGRGAGLRQTLEWLVGLRIEAAYRATGWRYELEFLTKRRDWDAFLKARGR